MMWLLFEFYLSPDIDNIIGGGAHTPQTAMSLAEELNTLRKQVKQQEKEIRRLKEENEFLAEASAFFAASRRKSAKGSE